MIDRDVPDEDKFNAMKTLFYSVISADVSEQEQILNYQIFQVAKNLTSNQLLILITCYDIIQKNEIPSNLANLVDWLNLIANRIGHGIDSLIERDEQTLVENKLLTPHLQQREKVRIIKDNARLTELGIKLCENLKKYDFKEMMSNENKSESIK